ncbi:MAG: hypothetical protein KAZ87_13400 [Spirochaetes bacterium]|nr:hypothetical protein [Spirochaetota bacterium]
MNIIRRIINIYAQIGFFFDDLHKTKKMYTFYTACLMINIIELPVIVCVMGEIEILFHKILFNEMLTKTIIVLLALFNIVFIWKVTRKIERNKNYNHLISFIAVSVTVVIGVAIIFWAISIRRRYLALFG